MKRILIGFVLAVMLVAAGLALLPRQQRHAQSAANFDAFMNAILDEAALPGVSVAVLSHGELVHLKGYGFADVAARRPMTGDTPMDIASVSKPVLGIALLRLRDEGRLDVDADIDTYLPYRVENPNAAGAPITTRMLATHTSSIADFSDVATYAQGVDSPEPLASYVASLLTPGGARYAGGGNYLASRPGAKREYSNLGAAVAGEVLEAVTHESLQAYQQRTLFRPLGMTHTSWRIADFASDQLAVRYRVRQCAAVISLCATTERPTWNEIHARLFDTPRRLKRFEAYGQLGNPSYPDGGLNSSAHDLAILMRAIVHNGVADDYRMLEARSFEDMLRPQVPALDERQRFFWRDRDGLTGHAGSDRGVFTYFYFDMHTGDGFVVLINRTPDEGTEAAMDQIAQRIRKEFFAATSAAPVRGSAD